MLNIVSNVSALICIQSILGTADQESCINLLAAMSLIFIKKTKAIVKLQTHPQNMTSLIHFMLQTRALPVFTTRAPTPTLPRSYLFHPGGRHSKLYVRSLVNPPYGNLWSRVY